jgi:hypothetical protein
MLDAFIIERIRQQRDGHESVREPLRVEIPLQRKPTEPQDGDHDQPAQPERGVVIIDDTI